MAYGQILPGLCWNCLRTAASIFMHHCCQGTGCLLHRAAIESGDAGRVSIVSVDEGLDTGDVITRHIPLRGNETGGIPARPVGGIAASCSSVMMISGGEVRRERQDDELATYAPKLERVRRVDWTCLPGQRTSDPCPIPAPGPLPLTMTARAEAAAEGLPGGEVLLDEGLGKAGLLA